LIEKGYKVVKLNFPHSYIENGKIEVSWSDQTEVTPENYAKYLENFQ